MPYFVFAEPANLPYSRRRLRLAEGKMADSTMQWGRFRLVVMAARSSSSNHPVELTAKEKDVLELVASQFTNKEIARQLEISCRAVEERLKTARTKLQAADRRSAARLYKARIATCERTTCGSNTLASDNPVDTMVGREAEGQDRSALTSGHDLAPASQVATQTLLDAYDARFGWIGRVGAVIGLAALLGLLLVAGVAVAVVAQLMFEA